MMEYLLHAIVLVLVLTSCLLLCASSLLQSSIFTGYYDVLINNESVVAAVLATWLCFFASSSLSAQELSGAQDTLRSFYVIMTTYAQNKHHQLIFYIANVMPADCISVSFISNMQHRGQVQNQTFSVFDSLPRSSANVRTDCFMLPT